MRVYVPNDIVSETLRKAIEEIHPHLVMTEDDYTERDLPELIKLQNIIESGYVVSPDQVYMLYLRNIDLRSKLSRILYTKDMPDDIKKLATKKGTRILKLSTYYLKIVADLLYLLSQSDDVYLETVTTKRGRLLRLNTVDLSIILAPKEGDEHA